MAIVAFKIPVRTNFRNHIHPKTVEFLYRVFAGGLVTQIEIKARRVLVYPANNRTRDLVNNLARDMGIDLKQSVLGKKYHGLQTGRYEVNDDGEVKLVV